MDITTINTKLVELQNKLDNADVFRQQVSLYMWGDGYTAIRFEIEYAKSSGYGSGYENFKRSLTHNEMGELNSVEFGMMLIEWFAEANAWVDAIPTAEERAHQTFTASLGRLIDQGRDIGIEVDFLNPLTSMMTKLATNALEDKRNS